MKLRISLIVWCLLGIATPCFAQSGEQNSTPSWLPVPADSTFATGDTWDANSIRYRLYGVQSCLRGTAYTDHTGVRKDCGEASMFMLASLMQDLKPLCYAVAQTRDGSTQFVICSAVLRQGGNAGKTLDIGTALISSGFGFAALKPDGQPINVTYAVAQNMAEEKRKGLWAFSDMPDPNAALLQSFPQAQQ
jgi:endonuclease YncB( thermonuclease family)